ncbi:MAG: tryptophan synthase subunit alpha [Lysobacterales bacterium CG17_big_fil_post_rev_8_21_14_2_50_64_11]|nr:MAG: tryptophan synthase subunit alpha [Xanthomonadales bacterium CG17_big_fil_post_rev_8_21_14_2_50_64_11]
MNRIDTRVAQLRAAGRKALIPFFTAADPSLDSTVPVMHALVAAGADLIELGMPFSDPMADGPVIQRSSERALARGAGMRYVLDAVRAFRARDNDTPVVLMGYLNPIEMRGAERFAQEASAAGVDGLLLVDLPPEEAHEARVLFNQHGLALVLLAAPTTSAERLARIAREAQGYLYYVSFAGVTGADSLRPSEVAERVASLRQMASVPVVVGFGVKDAASAAALAPLADGVVVGSALVSALDKAGGAGAATAATAFLAPLRAALDA